MSDADQPQLEPAIFIIFGITGNLAQKKLLPALYHLLKDNLLDENTVIVGVSRGAMTTDELLGKVELCVLEEDKVCDPAVIAKFRERLQMEQLDSTKLADYKRLKRTLDTIEDHHGVCMNRLFYLSIPPQVYMPVIENLGEAGLNTGCQHHKAQSRLLVEKPFGYDLTSAAELITHTAHYFDESQVFRIDHYLAKETAQNITVFRNHNPVFTSAWNNQHVTAIDLVFSETIGVEGRSEFYDNIGALRDVVQNHLMQLLTLITMEPLATDDSAALHEAKRKLLASIRPVDLTTMPVVRAQYKGYQEEVSNPGSATETYVKLTLDIDNDRWRGIPVTLTAGKALTIKQTAASLTFVDPSANGRTMNRLTFYIQPNEGIDVALTVKKPGFNDKTEVATMAFSYAKTFGTTNQHDAYERVLVDAVKGDHSLFATSDEVLESWRVIEPILHAWSQSSGGLLYYEPGSSGPDIPA